MRVAKPVLDAPKLFILSQRSSGETILNKQNLLIEKPRILPKRSAWTSGRELRNVWWHKLLWSEPWEEKIDQNSFNCSMHSLWLLPRFQLLCRFDLIDHNLVQLRCKKLTHLFIHDFLFILITFRVDALSSSLKTLLTINKCFVYF